MAKKTSRKTKTKAKKTSHRKSKSDSPRRGMWKGSIAFGLVNIPIYLESAQQEHKIHFRMIDKRDNAPIGYKQYNKVTGKEISGNSIVKGYEYEKGHFVTMTDTDFAKANVKATRTIDIEDFVDVEKIDPMYFDRPYYIVPQKGGEKGYVLLREALKKAKKAGVAKIVLHKVQHLVMILARGDYLILEILRFANEIKEVREAHLLDEKMKDTKVSEREVAVAEQLVEGMTADWKPEKYSNTYHDDLMKLIKSKIKRGSTAEIEDVPEVDSDEEAPNNVIDLTALLKKSLNATKGSKRKSHGA